MPVIFSTASPAYQNLPVTIQGTICDPRNWGNAEIIYGVRENRYDLTFVCSGANFHGYIVHDAASAYLYSRHRRDCPPSPYALTGVTILLLRVEFPQYRSIRIQRALDHVAIAYVDPVGDLGLNPDSLDIDYPPEAPTIAGIDNSAKAIVPCSPTDAASLFHLFYRLTGVSIDDVVAGKVRFIADPALTSWNVNSTPAINAVEGGSFISTKVVGCGHAAYIALSAIVEYHKRQQSPPELPKQGPGRKMRFE